MEELINHLHDHGQIWEKSTPIEAESIQVSEIWEGIPAGEQNVVHRMINGYNLEEWLKMTRPNPRKPSPFRQQCSLRIVWVNIGRKPNVQHMSESQVKAVVDAFKLGSAYTYYRTSGAGVTELSQYHGSRKQSQYAFSFKPKTAAIWPRQVDSNTLQGMIFTVDDHIKSLQLLLNRRWMMLDQDMFIPFLCSVLLGLQVDKSLKRINTDIRGIENRTGFHGWKSDDEKLAPSNLEGLLQMTGAMPTKMASSLRKIRVMTNLHRFVSERLGCPGPIEALKDVGHTSNGQVEALRNDMGTPADGSGRQIDWLHARIESHDRLSSVIALLEHRAQEQHIGVEYLQQRVRLQTQVIESVINQLDSLTALAQTEVSNRIAGASQRETFSMKALATVSMAFLPATFVAACFDMPLFNWDSAEITGVVSPRIWIFTLVAGVLTGLVSLTYWRWLGLQKQKHARETEHIPWSMEDDTMKPVIEDLVRTRQWVGKNLSSAMHLKQE